MNNKNTKIRYIGHSCFYININQQYGVIIDPFIKNNPLANFDYKQHLITHIFVTHAHGDHYGDAVEISKEKKAPIYTIFELANHAIKSKAYAVGTNLGGELNFEFGSLKFLNAQHSSSLDDGSYGGCPCSLFININGKKILHLGDTALHSDMELYGNIYKPDIVLCPIGGFYTMGIDDALIAAEMLKPRFIIPMHYNTFETIKADAYDFQAKINKLNKIKCIVMDINSEIDIEKL